MATQWNKLNSCCARPGFARSLRLKDVDAESLQDDAQHSSLLRGLAMSSRVTVADCELRHARNRTFASCNGRTNYASLCVSSILDEAKLNHEQTLHGAKERDKLLNVSQIYLPSPSRELLHVSIRTGLIDVSALTL